MTKARLICATAIAGGLLAVPAMALPALASPTNNASSGPGVGTGTSNGGPLLSVCVTVTPKSVSASINGDVIEIGPFGVPRSCTAV